MYTNRKFALGYPSLLVLVGAAASCLVFFTTSVMASPLNPKPVKQDSVRELIVTIDGNVYGCDRKGDEYSNCSRFNLYEAAELVFDLDPISPDLTKVADLIKKSGAPKLKPGEHWEEKVDVREFTQTMNEQQFTKTLKIVQRMLVKDNPLYAYIFAGWGLWSSIAAAVVVGGLVGLLTGDPVSAVTSAISTFNAVHS